MTMMFHTKQRDSTSIWKDIRLLLESLRTVYLF